MVQLAVVGANVGLPHVPRTPTAAGASQALPRLRPRGLWPPGAGFQHHHRVRDLVEFGVGRPSEKKIPPPTSPRSPDPGTHR
jgi:hypothetical protein